MIISFNLKSQTVIAFQGFEGTADDTWTYTAPTQNAALPQLIVGAGNYGAGYAKTGSFSMRFGGGSTTCGSGSGNCINGSSGGGGCNNNSNGADVTFGSVDVACYENIQIAVSHRTHQLCSGQGQGLDSGDNLNFEVSINGGAFVSQATVIGANNCGWTYTTAPGCSGGVANPYVFNVPPGTLTIALRVRLAFNRSDEVIYLDDVKLSGDELSGALPSISANGAITFCEGESVTLQTNNIGALQWNRNDEPIGGATGTSYSASTTGSYTLTVGSGPCATVSDPIIVTVTSAPVVSIEHVGSTTICEGESVTLQTNNSGPFQWNRNDEPIEDATGSNYLATTSGDYTLSIGSGTCDGISDVITVTVSDAPDVVITPNGTFTICDGESITLQTTNTGDLQWNFNDEPVENETGSTYEANQPGDYTLTVSNGTCEGISNTVTIIESEELSPTVTPTGTIEICDEEDVTLTVDGSYDSYQWYNGTTPLADEQSPEFVATQSGNYSVLVSQGACAGASEVIAVTVTQMSAPQLAQGFTACMGTTVDLFVPDNYESYQWFQSEDAISGQTNNTYSFVLTETVNISVQVTAGNCNALSNEITITAISLPIVSINPSTDVIACEESVLLTATSNTNSYQWLHSGTPIAGATSSTYTVTQDGDYSFISTALGSDCSATSSEITVILDSPLEVVIEASALSACEGETITLNVTGSFDSILWFNEETSNSINVTTSGLYSIEVTSGQCTSYDEIEITFNPIPMADAGNDTISDCDNGVVLTGTGTGILSWQSSSTLFPYDDAAIALANPSTTTTYILIASIGNCVTMDSVLVEADCNSLYIPNIFTPNGDGVNDFFEVKVRGASYFHLQIFNRWGEMLFESKDPSRVWNGGKQDYYAPDGVYFWTLDVLDANDAPMLEKDYNHGYVTIAR